MLPKKQYMKNLEQYDLSELHRTFNFDLATLKELKLEGE